jgi:N-formylmaleamate deformylase
LVSDWYSGDVIANGIRIHYHRTGNDKPAVVLSHGFTDSGLCWIRVAQILQKDYDLIIPDARGHGLSEAPEKGYGTDVRAADLAGLIEALGLHKPVLMGHSMGADTTAATAACYPHLVGRIVLEDPPWFEAGPSRAGDGRGLGQEQLRAQTDQWWAEVTAQKTWTCEQVMAYGRELTPMCDEIEFGPWADAKQQLSPHAKAVLEEWFPPWPEVVPRIQCPALLVIGDPAADTTAGPAIVSPELARQITQANPLIQVAHIKGAGHDIRREQFGPYVAAVSAFLGKQ